MNRYMIAPGIPGLTATDITLAHNEKDPYAVNFAADSITVNASPGWPGGESGQYVYDPDTGRKTGELNWLINNAAIIKGDISWDPLFWLTLNAGGGPH